MQKLRGWNRISNGLVAHKGEAIARLGKRGALFADFGSYIERTAYLFKGYEQPQIKAFLASIPRGGTMIDVGANVGNHSVFFAQHFDHVIAFEPNPAIAKRLERNAQMNRDRFGASIEIVHYGLGDEPGEFPFYDVAGDNQGLGTFSPVEQYDRPLQQIGTLKVVVGDDYLKDFSPVAIKIDVQGLEVNVLKGLRGLLGRARPVVWMEIGDVTLGKTGSPRSDLELLFPYPITLKRFVTKVTGPVLRTSLVEWQGDRLPVGDYVIQPCAESA